MNENASKVLAFLFLRGISCKRDLLRKACFLTEEELTQSLEDLQENFAHIPLPFILLQSESELELALSPQMTELFDPFIKKEREGDLTSSTLQTLTIIAYLDKPTKYEISFIRGVSATQSLSTLLAKGLIEEYEADKYVLSLEALSHLGITRKEDLPSYNEIRNGFLEKINNAMVT